MELPAGSRYSEVAVATFDEIADDLLAYQPLVIGCELDMARFSGFVEGLNNKAKVTMRKSYGFRIFHVLELALYHSLGKLPEPESTHDLF